MIKAMTNSLSRISLGYLRKSVVNINNRSFVSSTITKIRSQSCNIKGLREVDAEKAVKLIFSERKYPDFTKEEQRIVDLYQEKILEEDGRVLLPNTRADLEQREIEQLLKDA